jgi:hypothetical protein
MEDPFSTLSVADEYFAGVEVRLRIRKAAAGRIAGHVRPAQNLPRLPDVTGVRHRMLRVAFQPLMARQVAVGGMRRKVAGQIALNGAG